jgi:monovalent cation:H+ antiporter-2, CPA2 family
MTHADAASVYLQLGAVVFALGLGARLAGRLGRSPIPLYLLAVLSWDWVAAVVLGGVTWISSSSIVLKAPVTRVA